MPPEKKRKLNPDTRNPHSNSNGRYNNHEPSTSKPTAVFSPTKPRKSTLSVALPGSIIANAKSHDQKTYLAGSIARALAVFCVDEVIIFDDIDASESNGHSASNRRAKDEEGYTALSDPSHFLSHLLSYLETPPHLRKSLFPMHPNLRTAGTLPSLDMPHHLRASEFSPYREGVVTSSNKSGSEVDLGLSEPYFVFSVQMPPKMRVTLKITGGSTQAEAVAPTAPREDSGYYWGYTVRRCSSLSTVLTECPFDEGYDLSFGTSERGVPLSTLLSPPSQTITSSSTSRPEPIPKYQHMLLCFGGLAGLEHAATNDPDLRNKGITSRNVQNLFDYYINLVSGQGSRTIRTEEAVWLGLMGLRDIVESNRVES